MTANRTWLGPIELAFRSDLKEIGMTKPKKGSGAGLVIAAVGIAAIAVAVIGGKKKEKSKANEQVAGVNPPAQRKPAIKKVTLT